MSKNVKSRFNPHVIRAQKELSDQQRREDDQKRRDEELKEALHRKLLHEAGSQLVTPIPPVIIPAAQNNFCSRTEPASASSSSAPPANSSAPNLTSHAGAHDRHINK
ncbi:hypothetical protein K3495_g6651 [Podosphaera aphanis]|nr:hypothetical protein K3495_g6651 [Podosphaera aphanis]